MIVDTGSDIVLAEVDDGVGVVTLNRSERRNALHADMYRLVPVVLEQFIHDPEVGCIVITGAGAAFCAGGDVYEGGSRGRRGADAAASLTRNARMVVLLHTSPKPTIAALPGPAVGAGMSIALAADLRIADRSARLIPGWGKLGFSGDFGGTWFLSRLVGPSKALELLLDDTPVDMVVAERLGLVNRVVDDGELPAAARSWAKAIAATPRTAARSFKANVQQAAGLTLEDFLPLESERQILATQTDDHRAAVTAWLAEAAAKKAARG